MMTRADVEKWWPEFESLCLNGLKPDMAATSRSGLQLVAALADEELFRATAKAVVECMDYGGILPSKRPECWIPIARL